AHPFVPPPLRWGLEAAERGVLAQRTAVVTNGRGVLICVLPLLFEFWAAFFHRYYPNELPQVVSLAEIDA
ncbi:MAG: hypothetical protein ACI4P5_03645, partial [Candidatus Fimadaptatus sp.]